MEYDTTENKFIADLLTEPLAFKDGHVRAADEAGARDRDQRGLRPPPDQVLSGS